MAERRIPKRAYSFHKSQAARRGIGFHLTFEEWWALWEPHWSERGNGKHKKCMCRNGDQGAYEVGNVRIATNLENWLERAEVQRRIRSTSEGDAAYWARREVRSLKRAEKWLNAPLV